MKRQIIAIDEELCNGCGQCIPNCPEGALQMIEGKARLISDLFCDGLGACIGECPQGAITIEEREAQSYDERRVMENIARQGAGVIQAHLQHLADHGQETYLSQAVQFLKERGIRVERGGGPGEHHSGCPGARARELHPTAEPAAGGPARPSQLRQWPVQLHLLAPTAPYLRGSHLLLAADCVAYTTGDFHREFLQGKTLAIACPKLDSHQEIYLDKLTAMIDFGGVEALTVMTMEVPCCRGLLELARRAAAGAERSVPIEWIQIGVQGQVLQRVQVAEAARDGASAR